MQFEKCLTCPDIRGHKCAGPNFMAMPTKDLIEWICAFQKIYGITNAQLAATSGVPKGTIDGMKYRSDVRHDTIYLILKALIELAGGVWGGESCSAIHCEDSKAKETMAQQQEDIIRLEKENRTLSETIATIKDTTAFIKEQIKVRNRMIAFLAGLLTVAVSVIIGSLVIDLLNPNVGFFWR